MLGSHVYKIVVSIYSKSIAGFVYKYNNGGGVYVNTYPSQVIEEEIKMKNVCP